MPASLTKARITQSIPAWSFRSSSVKPPHTQPPALVTCRSPEMVGIGATPNRAKKTLPGRRLFSAAACQLPPTNIATRPATTSAFWLSSAPKVATRSGLTPLPMSCCTMRSAFRIASYPLPEPNAGAPDSSNSSAPWAQNCGHSVVVTAPSLRPAGNVTYRPRAASGFATLSSSSHVAGGLGTRSLRW